MQITMGGGSIAEGSFEDYGVEADAAIDVVLFPPPYSLSISASNCCSHFEHSLNPLFAEWRKRVKIYCGDFDLMAMVVPRDERPDESQLLQDTVDENAMEPNSELL